jgi:hypothetical protein
MARKTIFMLIALLALQFSWSVVAAIARMRRVALQIMGASSRHEHCG